MKEQRQFSEKQQGFTLIELLVVIVIIGVLAALIFPVFSASKAAGNRTTCLSSFRQLSLAESLYRQDSEDMFVPRVAVLEGKDTQYDILLMPYVKTASLWSCVDSKKSDQAKTRSIGLNRALGTAYDGSNLQPKPVSGSTIMETANTLVFAEDAASYPNQLPPLMARNELAQNVLHACTAVLQKAAGKVTNDYAAALLRHNDGGNYSMADGSSKRMTPVQTLTPKVMWYVQGPEWTSLAGSSAITASSCADLAGNSPIPGADPVTGN